MKKLFFLAVLFLAVTANAQYYDWAFNVGGANSDGCYSISTDTSGNIYVTGSFRNTADFDPSINTANLTSNSFEDVFVAKYDAFGNYLWAFNVGGAGNDKGHCISTDPAGSGGVYITGWFFGTADFDPSGNTANLTSIGSADIFVANYDANGNYLWAFNIGETSADYGYGITTDTAGSGGVYITGRFRNTTDFDPSGNTANLTSNGGDDIFVAKYDATGNYLWAFNVGGINDDWGYGITTDLAGSGDVYITSYFRDTADFDPSGNTANLISNGSGDIYIAKYDTNGNYLWAFNIGGTSSDYGYGVATEPTGSGDVFVTGLFRDTADFDPSGNTANLISIGGGDIFVAKYDASGNYLWAFNVEGTGVDRGHAIAPDAFGYVYITGFFMDTADFDPSGNIANLTSNGIFDIFIAKYDVNGNYKWAFDVGATGDDKGNGITIDPAASGSVYVTGWFENTADFDPLANTANLTSNGNFDIFVAKYSCNYNSIDTAINICNGDSAFIYGNYETATGTYYDSLTTINGCDSVYSTVLTVNPVYNIIDNPVNICNGDVVLIYGNNVTAAGTYYNNLTTTKGCDSIHSVVVTVDPVFASTDTITITQGDSTFLEGTWQTIAGIYYDTLIATNGCDSVVATTLIVTVGIDEYTNSYQIAIYPNPTEGQFTISSRQGAIKKVEVCDLFGRKVLESKEPEIDMRGYAKGVYFVRVGEVVRKLVLH